MTIVAVVVLWFALLIAVRIRDADAIPVRGNEPWSMVLCKFRNQQYEPRTPEWFREWLSGENRPDTIEKFFADLSNGIYTIRGSNVHGWYFLPWSETDVWRRAIADPNLDGDNELRFYEKAKQLCIWLAQRSGARLHARKITIVNSGKIAIFDRKTGVLLSPPLIFSSVLAHEMIHSFHIGHSYSDRPIKVFKYSKPGEYDDRYDLMSTSNALMHPSTYGLTGPGLNGPHLDYLGWLPMNRIFYVGLFGHRDFTFRMSSLSVPHRRDKGWLLAMIPYDRDDPSNYYTVEFRTPSGNDAGITHAGVVIHRVHRNGSDYYSTLITDRGNFYALTEGTEWTRYIEVNDDGSLQLIRVRVLRIDARKHSANIHISTTFDPRRCRRGERRRQFRPPLLNGTINYVCIGHNDSAIFDVDVAAQAARNSFFTGPHTSTFGMNACDNGYVWRAIDPYDYVCVNNERKTEVETQNAMGLNAPDGECARGRTHRAAFPGDTTCVASSERTLAVLDNVESHVHQRHYVFFNGGDKQHLSSRRIRWGSSG